MIKPIDAIHIMVESLVKADETFEN